MRVLDLFSGVGGFSLGLERAGMTTVAFCEIEPYCRRVLAKHWPNVPIYGDIRELTAERLRADGISVDLVCGGFPCQDISVAGNGAGLAGERSGLWSEYARLVGELRPRRVIVENVAALLGRGLGRVLGDLAALGYDAEWHIISAADVGAPHRRERIWIMAHPQKLLGDGSDFHGKHAESEISESGDSGGAVNVSDSNRAGCTTRAYPALGDLHRPNGETTEATGERPLRNARTVQDGAHGDVADAKRRGQQGSGEPIHALGSTSCAIGKAIDALNGGVGEIWRVEPNVGRVAHGIPNRVDRLRALGNAVVPQIPEIIGRAIMESQRES
jgi:DNA (cytosine-5)-methyltransferase 1